MQTLEVFQSMWAMERRRPDGLEWPLEEKLEMIAAAGYDGVDVVASDPIAGRIGPLLDRHGLAATVTAFPKSVADLEPAIGLARDLAARHLNIIGQVYPVTIEAGADFVRGWLRSCERVELPVTIETHRDAITTDLLYTLQLMDAVPEMRLSADLSHFVVAREFGWPISDEVRAQITLVLRRADAFQGRVASREQVQLPICFPQHRDWFEVFLGWWEEGFRLWRNRSAEDARLNFLCELGPKEYAITGADGFELSDRWQDALTIKARVAEIWDGLEVDSRAD